MVLRALLDFMTEALYDSRRVPLLTIIDEGNHEGLEIAMGLSLTRRRVVRILNELAPSIHPLLVWTYCVCEIWSRRPDLNG
jgi:hypothetical protein